MLTYIVLGTLAALSFIVILYRTGALRKFLGYPVALDIIGLSLMVLMLHATITGVLIGIVGALVFSASLFILRWACGYEVLMRREGHWRWVSCRPPFGGFGSVVGFYWRQACSRR